MRIACQSIEEFLERLADVPAADVPLNEVNFSLTRRPLDGTRFTAVKFEVSVLVTTLIRVGGGEMLLEAGEYCGMDYNDGSQEKDGSVYGETLRRQVDNFCKPRGHKVRPGALQI